jgi:hypothetical protein
LEIIDRAKKEDEIPDNLEEEYAEFQIEDDDDISAEEGDC